MNIPQNDPLLLPVITDSEDTSSPFKNRIRKNYLHRRKWAKRTNTNCFRIYDRDIKEYPVVIDFYAGNFCIQYFSFDRESDAPPAELQQETQQALMDIFGAKKDSFFSRMRRRRTKDEQYEKIGEAKQFFTVREYGVLFQVNLLDYLDTGLFLDHRETRQMVAKVAKGKRVLNLFAYTCSFSVHAAMAGASYTKSVDLSNTYLAWGKENFALNSLSCKTNDFVRADCLQFLDEEIRSSARYDIIIVDPPTLSRSKKMEQMFDIQQDYASLLTKALQLLSPGKESILFFSTNSRKFDFDPSLFPTSFIRDISQKTIPLDFHNTKIHRAWTLQAMSDLRNSIHSCRW